MIKLKTAMKWIPVMAAVCMLAACSTGGTEPSSSSTPSTQNSSSAPTASPVQEDNAAETPQAATETPAATEEQTSQTDRPQTQSFDLRTGETTAALKQGEQFSFYAFEGFDFDAATGRLSLAANDDYYADMKRLPEGEDLKQLRESAEKELKAFGKVSDYSGELVEHPLGHAELYLQSTGAEGIRDYIVWKSETGEQYLFRISNPKGEEASAFSEKLWVSLSTVRGE
ncbi:hypothetical protein M3194_00295 [Paenibacillus glycanilyticus]|uniref:hypothetical protein n=1 Tax=Paenibacillus glycanilyticus TaxID=126569 RepID=UPI00203FA85F|nr:hypothetical protein [Paenibacillus glycanilyticus]MCM3625799.1 hypothetical protein [Paenibacillus glycanilyticus]